MEPIEIPRARSEKDKIPRFSREDSTRLAVGSMLEQVPGLSFLSLVLWIMK